MSSMHGEKIRRGEEMKKKWIAMALSIVMAAALTGCSGELSNEYITIKQYKGLEVTQVETTEVTDETVENTVNSNVEASQTKETITDRAAQEGDTVDMDYVGTVDGVAFDGGTATGTSLTLGSGQYIGANGDYKGFEEQIVGHTAGENFDITVKFPADYMNTEMADKVAVFNITLNEIYTLSTPELTDEWVQANSETSSTVEEYKKEVREQLEATNEENVNNTLKSEVLEALLEQVEVKELPEDQVSEQYQATEDYYTYMAQAYGMEFADFLTTYMGMTEDEFKEQAQTSAEEFVTRKLACELLAEKKNLEPSDEEYQAKLEEYAEAYGYEDLESFEEEMGEDVIRNAVLQDKVAEYLIQSCVQVEATE